MTTEWWCRGDLTAILEAAHDRQEIPLSRPYVLIGSGEAADVRLTAPGIPRRLLYVHASQAGLFAVPLVEPSQFQPLPQGRLLDRVPLQLGPYRITFHWQPEPEPQTGHDEERGEGDRELREGDLCRRGSLGGPGWEVEVRCDGQTLALIHIRRRLTLIGRRKPCAVQFAHPTVSACHCMVIAERERLWVADLGSANGTLLDGEAVTAAAWPEHVPLSIGRLNLVPRRRSGAEDAGGEDAAGPAGASEVLPGASSEVSSAVAIRKSPPDAPPLDGGDGQASTREPDRGDAPPQTRRSERRFRHAAAHPGFPPPHIVLPVVSPQNNPIISDGPERDGAEGDEPRRSGWHGDETLPAAGTQNTLPPTADAIPPPAEAGNDRPPADRSDGAAGLVSPENDFITIAANGAGPGETDVLLVVPPSADAGQWISEQPAGFAM
ncbi:MAG: FHA domain-containing protein, partial [Thermogutta sp.]|nr:FHA domain-containing protein [Thermogutta sp.]